MRTAHWRRDLLPLVLLACLVLGSGPAGLARAATPSSGTLSASSAGPTTWTGTAPGGAAADESACVEGVTCDTFLLTLSGTPSDWAGKQARVAITWQLLTTDYDLYIHKGSVTGPEVARSASALTTSESTAIDPSSARTGLFAVHVVYYSATSADQYRGSASVESTPRPAPPSPALAPGYVNYPAPDGLATRAGEPSIGVNWNTGNVFLQARTQTLRVSFDDTVAPAQATWADKSAEPPRCSAATTLDPILFTDPNTGRSFESQLLFNPVLNSLTCFTDDDGETWVPSQGGGIGSGVDHQTIGGGPFSAADPVGPTTPYPNAVVYCSQDIGDALCSVSHDGGLTFSPAVPIYTVAECGGLHGHVKVAPDGTIYVPNKSCGGRQAVIVSTDGGLTWAVRQVPQSTTGVSDPSVGIGANGTIYFGYQGAGGHPYVAVSRDQGVTWSDSLDVGQSFGLQNVVFPAVVAGDDDKAAVAFHGTTSAGDFQAPAFAGEWHLYVAHTYDGGATWVTSDATPGDPVQRGCIWMRGGSNPCRNLLDFIDATVDASGRVLVGYADGCIRACVTSPNPAPGSDGYRTQLGTIARQADGLRLFAGATTAPAEAAGALLSDSPAGDVPAGVGADTAGR